MPRFRTPFVLITLAPLLVAQESEWRVAPYAWIAGMEGSIGAGDPGSGGIDHEFTQLSDNLELGGAMFYAEWRRGPWSVFGDWTHVRVRSDAESPFGALYSGLDAELKGNVAQLAAGHELLRTEAGPLDLFAGLRLYDLQGSLALRPGTLAARSVAGDSTWIDCVVGTRWRARLGEDWEVGLYGDVGAGGSALSWQLLASVGHRFSWGSITAGWRHLDIDYDDPELRLDAALTGPFLGAVFRF